MEDLFAKIGLQLISQCKIFILSVQAEETGNRLWEKDPDQVRVPLFVVILVRGEFMCVCLRCCHNGQEPERVWLVP